MKSAHILACLLLLALAISTSPVPLLDDDIGGEIFHDAKQYLIYVHVTPEPTTLSAFQEFCATGKLCAILNSENEIFERITDFVGFYEPEYFLVFDIENRQKYCIPARNGITSQQIASFYQDFQDKKLEPYYNSQPIPTTQNEEKLTKVVGLTFQQFISQPDIVRVLYLYTQDELCSNCHDVYLALQKSANIHGGNGVSFGFFDLFKNQHKNLKEEDVPLLLIFKPNSREYAKLNSDQLDQLNPTIEDYLKKSEEL